MKTKQCTDTVMMIRPKKFGYNEQTATSNAFQQADNNQDALQISNLALKEFDDMVALLKKNKIKVIQIEDTDSPVKPDAIFPNNWISTHSDGSLITYSMFTENRRAERREDIVSILEKDFKVKQRYSFEGFEEEGLILEGTGSMILDRESNKVYACVSPRTDPSLLDRFSLLKRYEKILFNAVDTNGAPVYHTNVIMSIGAKQAIVCTEAIKDEQEKNQLLFSLKNNGKELIEISWYQVLQFAGNMLQLVNTEGEYIWVMSSSAYLALDNAQKTALTRQSKIIHTPIPTIERYGGGSVRCMLAEIFLEENG